MKDTPSSSGSTTGTDQTDKDTPEISRRSALKALGAAGGLGLAGLASAAPARGASMDEPIRVGLQAELTGVLAIYGFWHRRVLRGWVNELNEHGGINGRPIELLIEDTASDGKQGVRAMRKLVQQRNADFVIGSQSSGISIATNPLAKQLRTPFFPIGEAPSITGEDGNRWVIRNNHSSALQGYVALEYGLNAIGDQWSIVYQDYAFGQQYRDIVKAGVLDRGGDVLQEIPVPLGTSDLTPYLAKVPDGTEVLFSALVGPSSLNFLKQSAHLDTPGRRLGAIASVEGVDISNLGEGAEGAAYATMMPRELDQLDTPYNRHLRSVARVNETDKVMVGGHYASSYQALSWIKEAVEAVGWSSSEDNQDLIRWFERGPSREASMAFPQGDQFFRGEDHQAFMDMYVEEIRDGRLQVVDRIEIDSPPYPPAADFTQQSF